MTVKETGIHGLIEIVPPIFNDDRGYFLEIFNAPAWRERKLPHHFVQDNLSFSRKGVLRGLHFQRAPYAQGKLVRVMSGKALDVAVDLRLGSPTFGHHRKFMLEADLGNMVYIPEGFAHGFTALQDCLFYYKCTNVYHRESDGGLLWNDPDLGIDWGIENPKVSEKDQNLPMLNEYLATINP